MSNISVTRRYVIDTAMENYFKAYLKKYGHKKNLEDAIEATRNYIEGYIKVMYEMPFIDKPYTDLIEKKLNELRLSSEK
ncbi:MAG: hypothetical protein QXS29_09625 [Nitrososphaeria archaeon]